MSYQRDGGGPWLHPRALGGGLSEGWVGRGPSDNEPGWPGLHHRSGLHARDTPRSPRKFLPSPEQHIPVPSSWLQDCPSAQRS